MTAVVSRERARATGLTGAAGVLMLVVAVVMMIVAAPAHVHHRAHGPAKTSASQLTSDVCRHLTARSDSTTVRVCRAGPSTDSAWVEAYVPSMTSESWSASSPGRTARPPLATSRVKR